MTLTVGGRQIQTTTEHPFWVKDRGWVEACDLTAGDELSTSSGEWVAIENVVNDGTVTTVYNMTVELWHTYFVGEPSWGFDIWVHNNHNLNSPQGNVASKVINTLDHVRKTGKAPNGYKGGRTFRNDGRGGGQVLSKTDADGNPITYREFDVNSYQKGVNRGPERLVVGSDGRAYFTSDHYQTFTEILQ